MLGENLQVFKNIIYHSLLITSTTNIVLLYLGKFTKSRPDCQITLKFIGRSCKIGVILSGWEFSLNKFEFFRPLNRTHTHIVLFILTLSTLSPTARLPSFAANEPGLIFEMYIPVSRVSPCS